MASNAQSLGARRPEPPAARTDLRKSRRIIVVLQSGGPSGRLLEGEVVPDRDELLSVAVAHRPVPEGEGDRNLVARGQRETRVGGGQQRAAQDDHPAVALSPAPGRDSLRGPRAHRQTPEPL